MGLIDPPGASPAAASGSTARAVRPAGEERRKIRGNRIAMIFQDPMMTLNPVLRIDTQMIEAMRAHDRCRPASGARQRAATRWPGRHPVARRAAEAYPHQFSGGMRQRVAIAIALLNKPDLIIADEPTTALDVTIQGQILYEMQKLARETGTALIWITHDLSVIAGLADEWLRDVCRPHRRERHRQRCSTGRASLYAWADRRRCPAQQAASRCAQIPGMTPSLLQPAAGLRVPHALRRAPAAARVARRRSAIEGTGARCAASTRSGSGRGMRAAEPMLELANVSKRFVKPLDAARGSQPARRHLREDGDVHAVDDVAWRCGRARSWAWSASRLRQVDAGPHRRRHPA
jgi:ABC-type dipeptide/oligopeptide/nickel transport system ATPase component